MAYDRGVAEVSQTFCTSFLSLRQYVGERHGKDAFKRVREKLAAEHEVKWVHRAVLRFTSPLWLLERGADVWKKSHTTGRWHIESDRPRHLRGTLEAFGVADRAYCDSLRGWLQRACLMTGEAHVAIAETRCRDRDGAAACVFEGQW